MRLLENFKLHTRGSHVSTGQCWSRNHPDVLLAVHIPDDLSQWRFFSFLDHQRSKTFTLAYMLPLLLGFICISPILISYRSKMIDHLLPWCFSHSQFKTVLRADDLTTVASTWGCGTKCDQFSRCSGGAVVKTCLGTTAWL